jgi:hypothetical protein
VLSSVVASFEVPAQNQEVAVQMQAACFLLSPTADNGSELLAVLELLSLLANGCRDRDCEAMRPVMIRSTQL